MKQGQAAVLLVVVIVAALGIFMLFMNVDSTGNAVLDHYGLDPAMPWGRPAFADSCDARACYRDVDCGGECGRCSWSTHTCVGLSNPPNTPINNAQISTRIGQPQYVPNYLAMRTYGECLNKCKYGGLSCLGETGDQDILARKQCYGSRDECESECEQIFAELPRAQPYDAVMAGPWKDY